MPWTEIDLLIRPLEPWRDLLMVELAELGFDSFEETPQGLKAAIRSDRYDRSAVDAAIAPHRAHMQVGIEERELPDTNWNAVWEAGFEPVRVGGEVLIRAGFHPAEAGFGTEIVITPRMAFGTGHHATTRLMVEAMLKMDLAGKAVCDMGCGTGVLAILAARRGATDLLAVDNDPQAVDNARENLDANGCAEWPVVRGDVNDLHPDRWDVILANIERNTLLRGMPALSAALRPGGTLLLSGFLAPDTDALRAAARMAGLRDGDAAHDGEWTLLTCHRP
ncbi:MAG TPA: 50S ribosomal protein L11 methyltransferase [Flavobacteriales bacterium]|nr:50S ribosomal protein L11 methyltransferase [Flavobacteriales bacterium]HQW87281.1 50S ribosomal protein L11 methyltransferase [Flavobacteriales bacterium]